ncbi:hypothetical protein GQ53DRAFT_823491 [Thozetella sp. PMI_491]|nr:hypothetical protein GQ53DRAFT_823491 [Thozetella sp. PMI_491]
MGNAEGQKAELPKELLFLASLDLSNHYPENLASKPEFRKVGLDFTRDFRLKLGKITIQDSPSHGTIDYRAGPSIFIQDYQEDLEGPISTWATSLKDIQTALKLPRQDGASGQVQLDYVLARAKNKRKSISGSEPLPRDVKFYGSFFEADFDISSEIDTFSALRLRATKDMLLQILSYHQVSAAYLSFLSYFGYKSVTSESDALFGGFRYLRRLDDSKDTPRHNTSSQPLLGRSGHDFQLAFEFKAVFLHREKKSQASINRERTDYKMRTSEYSWSRSWWWERRQKDEPALPYDVRDKLRAYLITQAAVYHHFDLDNGKALWIITGPNEELLDETGIPDDSLTTSERYLRSYRNYVDVRTNSPGERLRSALDVILWIGQWSLSEFAWYIDLLDQAVGLLTEGIVDYPEERMTTGITPATLKQLNGYLEKANQCIINLNANIRVCGRLKMFYQEQLLADVKGRESMAWIAGEKSNILEFTRKNGLISSALENLCRRADQLVQVGKRRESVMKGIMHSENKIRMKHEARRTSAIALLTFVLFPLTLTTTFMAAGIVKFDDPDNLVGQWSRGGGLWFISITIILCGLFISIYVFMTRSLRESYDGGDAKHIGLRQLDVSMFWFPIWDLVRDFELEDRLGVILQWTFDSIKLWLTSLRNRFSCCCSPDEEQGMKSD